LTRIWPTDPLQPDSEAIAAAAAVIQDGGVVVIPTRHLYGLAADALNVEAIQRVFAIKRRPATKPLLILEPSRLAIEKHVSSIPAAARRLMDRFWPGRLTLVFEAADALPAVLTGGTGKIGIRLPAHPVCRALLDRRPRPVTATSANISGQKGCHRIADMPSALKTAVDLIIDAGPLAPGPGSTVVDVTAVPARILREGSLGADRIAAALAETP
jgi:L-threonylcarbamoyladenylate synthase